MNFYLISNSFKSFHLFRKEIIHELSKNYNVILVANNDDYYEYSDMNSQEVSDTLPTELDEAFCISESMAEWEAENAEDEENIDIDLDGGVSATNEQEQHENK